MTSPKKSPSIKKPKNKRTTVKRSKTKKKSKSKALEPNNPYKVLKNSEVIGMPERYHKRFPKVTPKNAHEIRTLMAMKKAQEKPCKVKYSQEFNPMVKSHMADGKELNEFAHLINAHRTTIHDWASLQPTFADALIDGQMLFIDSLADKLILWMNDGFSFESFGSQIGRSRDWLYELAKYDPLFATAKEIGTVKSMAIWENLLKAQTSGSLSRLKSSKPVLDKKGQIQYDQNNEVIVHKEYVPAMGSDRALVFAMRSRFAEYRPEERVTDAEAKGELDEALAIINKEDDAAHLGKGPSKND